MGTKSPTTEKHAKAKAEDTAEPKAVKLPKGSSNLQNVPVDRIKVKKGFNPRGSDIGDITALTKSVRSNGITQPITLCPTSEGADTYYIVAGHRRFQAAVDLNKETVPANIVPHDINSVKAFVIAATENVGSEGDDAGIRKDLTPLQYAAAGTQLRKLLTAENEAALAANPEAKAKPTDDKAIADALGVAYSRMRRYMQLYEIPESLRKRVEDGTVSARAAVTLLEVPDELRNAVAKRIVAGVDAAEVTRIANEMKDEKAGKTAKAEKSEKADKPEKAKKPKNLVTEKDVRKIAAEEKANAVDNGDRAVVAAVEEAAAKSGRRLCTRPFGQRPEFANGLARRGMDEMRGALRTAVVAVLNAQEAKDKAKEAGDADAAGKAQLTISINKAIASALSWSIGETTDPAPVAKGDEINALLTYCQSQLDDEAAMAAEAEKAEKPAKPEADADEPTVVKKPKAKAKAKPEASEE